MKLLALESSSHRGALSVITDAGQLHVRSFPEGVRHSRHLVSELKGLLSSIGWLFGDLDCIALNIGPGSYTGLRIGVTMAKVFCYATSARLVAVRGPEIIARGCRNGLERPVAVLIDAQEQSVYAATYRRQANTLHELQPLRIVSVSEWIRAAPRDCLVTGDGLLKHAQTIQAAGFELAARDQWFPSPTVLAHMGLEAAQNGQFADPFTVVPLYLRKSSAEILWEKRTAE